jgi:hypothetical protein
MRSSRGAAQPVDGLIEAQRGEIWLIPLDQKTLARRPAAAHVLDTNGPAATTNQGFPWALPWPALS